MQSMTRLFYVALFMVLTCSTQAWADAKYLFKIASLAPEGSVWVNEFQEFAKEVKEKTNGEVEFRIYSGGIMGDDQAMYQRLRVGQLQGGGFTMTGIASIVPDFRAMAMPFFFRSYDEVDKVRDGLTPSFKKEFNNKGLEFLAMTEVGFIYAMSTGPIKTIDDLRRNKCWAPTGDPVTGTYLSELGITPIPLSIPDVMTSLETGLINTVFNSLYGAIVLQWYTKTQFITDIPFGYAYGVILLDKNAFSKLPENYAVLIHAAADRHFAALLDSTRKSNNDSRQVLEQNGVKFIQPAPGIVTELELQRDNTVKKLIGSAFSSEIYARASKILQDFRASKPATTIDAAHTQPTN